MRREIVPLRHKKIAHIPSLFTVHRQVTAQTHYALMQMAFISQSLSKLLYRRSDALLHLNIEAHNGDRIQRRRYRRMNAQISKCAAYETAREA